MRAEEGSQPARAAASRAVSPRPSRRGRAGREASSRSGPGRPAAAEWLEGRTLLSTVHFTVNPAAGAKPISPYIYGVNRSLDGDYANLTFTRSGGNRWTAYNWENNASNAGSDYQYQNDAYLGGGTTPGGAVLPTLQNAASHNAAAMVTVPINGYVAADKNGGGDVRNSGSNYLQTRFKQLKPRKGSAFSLTPDTTDGYVYADEFVNWVKAQYPTGQTSPGNPIFYSLDNEPDLWSSTHAEVHPQAVTYAELAQKSIEYAAAIKSASPAGMVFGPANYGWSGYVNLQNAPDAGGRDFQAFYLQQLKAASDAAGTRLLDALDVHWYPEATGGGVRITGQDTSDAVVAARLQAPRSLWDPTYTESSWISQWGTQGPVTLLPRLQQKIAANYAGTKLAVTEYDYGGGNHISGGIAQADVLGIFGRDGVYAASQWALSGNEPYVAGAFKMFRNYDGAGGAFGATSVSANTDDVAASSVYASTDPSQPGVVTLVAINKTAAPLTSVTNLAGVAAAATASVYQLTAASTNPQAAGTVTVADPSTFTYTLPAYSVVTIKIVGGGTTTPTPTPTPLPVASVNSVSVAEGAAGATTPARFTISLSAAATASVTVSYATADGSATTAGNDYLARTGSVTFAPGETSKTVDVTVVGDNTVEADEAFTLKLVGATGATLGSASAGTGTIRNDDAAPLPAITVQDVAVAEGNGGTTAAVFTLKLSAASTSPVNVRYATADGTATAGSDFAEASGTVTFAAGQTQAAVSVAVAGDTAYEPDETFALVLTNPTNATVGTPRATGTIRNDDAPASPKAAITFTKTNDWGSGFTADMTIRNLGTTAIQGWTLEFDLPATITNIWSANIVSRSGNHYVLKAAYWNETIAPGQAVTFGFLGEPGLGNVIPTNIKLNGVTV